MSQHSHPPLPDPAKLPSDRILAFLLATVETAPGTRAFAIFHAAMHEGHAEAERTANSFKPIFFGGGLMMIDEKHGCIYHWGDSPHGRITARDNMERMLREAHPAFDIQSGASPPGFDENFARQK